MARLVEERDAVRPAREHDGCRAARAATPRLRPRSGRGPAQQGARFVEIQEQQVDAGEIVRQPHHLGRRHCIDRQPEARSAAAGDRCASTAAEQLQSAKTQSAAARWGQARSTCSGVSRSRMAMSARPSASAPSGSSTATYSAVGLSRVRAMRVTSTPSRGDGDDRLPRLILPEHGDEAGLHSEPREVLRNVARDAAEGAAAIRRVGRAGNERLRERGTCGRPSRRQGRRSGGPSAARSRGPRMWPFWTSETMCAATVERASPRAVAMSCWPTKGFAAIASEHRAFLLAEIVRRGPVHAPFENMCRPCQQMLPP